MAETFTVGKGFKFGGAAGGPKGFRIESRIGVQAPPEVIWSLVHDLDAWADWNPTYPKASGVVRIGELLTLTQALPGRAHRTLRPRVLEWVPNEQLHWRLSELAGLARTTGFVEIEKLADASCIVSSGELSEGFLAPFVVHAKETRRGLRAMNEALKAAAEAAWKSQAAAPTSGAR